MRKTIVSAISLICSECQSENLTSEKVVRVDDGKIYFIFICQKCNTQNNVELLAIVQGLYTTPFASGGESVN